MCSLFYFKGSSQSLRISTSMWLAMRLGFPCVAFARGLWTGQLWMLSTISRASTFLTPSPIPVPTATRWLLPGKRCKGIFRSVKFLLFECINIGHWSTGVFYVTELWEGLTSFSRSDKKAWGLRQLHKAEWIWSSQLCGLLRLLPLCKIQCAQPHREQAFSKYFHL